MTAFRFKPVRSVPRLGANEVHIWLAALDVLPLSTLLNGLSPDESARADRFHFARDKQRFVAARGVLRHLLGRYLDVAPGALRFDYGPRGKPSLAAGAWPGGLRVNVSHSGGLALLGFARERELGVDLEFERPVPDAESIAQRYFSPREAAVLGWLTPADRPAAFFRCWTRKEAFIKATGDGLSRPLDAFDVTLAPGEPARLLRVDGEPPEAARWWMVGLEPAEGFAAAVAVEGRPASLGCWQWKDSLERSYGPRGKGRQDDLQGGREPRRAVLDLAR
jgi:4'-phosphopantetheinyl transferase